MNTNWKRNIFLIITFFMSMPLFSFSKDTIPVSLYEIQVSDSLIFPLLDKAIIHEMKHKRGNNTFEIKISKNQATVELTIAYLNERDKKIYNKENYGFLMYKNNLFFIGGECKVDNYRFFRKTKTKRTFEFIVPEGLYIGTDETSWFYYYQNGEYNLNYLFDERIKPD